VYNTLRYCVHAVINFMQREKFNVVAMRQSVVVVVGCTKFTATRRPGGTTPIFSFRLSIHTSQLDVTVSQHCRTLSIWMNK